MNSYLEGARGIEPPLCVSGKADGFEDRGAPSTIAPVNNTFDFVGFIKV